MLLAVPKYGRVKVDKILRQCKISPSKTVGGLSERQRNELVGLDLANVDLGEGIAHVRGKGKRERIALLGPPAVEAITAWLAHRAVLLGPRLRSSVALFVNKRGDRLKALWWDQDGLIIWYKRLECGCFERPAARADQKHVTLDATELAMLLGGVSLASVKRRKRFSLAS